MARSMGVAPLSLTYLEDEGSQQQWLHVQRTHTQTSKQQCRQGSSSSKHAVVEEVAAGRLQDGDYRRTRWSRKMQCMREQSSGSRMRPGVGCSKLFAAERRVERLVDARARASPGPTRGRDATVRASRFGQEHLLLEASGEAGGQAMGERAAG